MISFIVNANIKPGLEQELKDAVAATADFISEHEPDFATYAHFEDGNQVTFVNLASDSDALAAHFAAAPNNAAGPAMMGAIEVTSVDIYGDLSPEVEAMVAGMNPRRRTPAIGTFDRRLQAS